MLNGNGRLSDRSSRDWAIQFALSYFGLDEAALDKIAGKKGQEFFKRLWREHKEDFYHFPEIVLRQEWFHAVRLNRGCSDFYEQLEDNLLLDFGCGTAETERSLWIDKGQKTVLMDIEGPNFEYIKAKYSDLAVDFHTINGALPHSYDGFLCLDVLEHIPQPISCLKALWENLKPGGQALIWFDPSYPYPGHLKESVNQISLYDRWLLKNTTIIKQEDFFDWVEKPKRFWRIWN